MSELLDERVVEMRFDNTDFEQNVHQSIQTINKLKESLDFDDAGDSFDNLSASAASVDLSPIEESVEQISVKFNMLEMVAAQVLGNIVNKAIDAGSQLVKSLTIDQVNSGWSKYEMKTQAVQTIMAATKQSIEAVNKQLDKLSWFADETSYDFVDMVDNIGKFTSAGIDMDKSVNSMIGISTWAALSGAGVQKASRAMYNLSQAMSMGYVGIQDWKSIELANMATLEFKQTVIDTAVAMGTLKQEADGTIKTLDGKDIVTAESMRNTLKKQWFSGDVLTTALDKYSEFANLVYEVQEELSNTTDELWSVSDVIDYIKENSLYDLNSMSAQAFIKAQEALSLTQAINATTDAVSSGWMKTFELIFGNYEQAKKLWTSLAYDMWDIFASSADRRNNMLSGVMRSQYDQMARSMPDPDDFNKSLYDKLYAMTKDNRGEALAEAIFNQYDSLEELLKNETVYGSELKAAFQSMADDNTKEIRGLEELSKNLKEKETSLKKAAIMLATNQFGADEEQSRKAVEKLGWDYDLLLQYAEDWKKGIEVNWDAEQKAYEGMLDEQITSLKGFTKQLREVMRDDSAIAGLTELGGRDKLIGGFQNIISFFKNLYLLIVEIGDGFSSLFGSGSALSSAIDIFYKLTGVLGDAGSAFEMLQGAANNFFHKGLPDFWDRFLHGYDAAKESINETGEIIDNIPEEIVHIPGLIDRLTEMYKDHLAGLPEEVQQTITNITGKITDFFSSIPQKYEELKTKLLGEQEEYTVIDINANTVEHKTRRIGGLINELKDNVMSFGGGILPKVLNGASDVLQKIMGFLFNINKESRESKSIIEKIFDKVNAFINKLKDIGKLAKDIFGTVLGDIKTFFTGGKYSFSNNPIFALPERLKKHFEDLKKSPAYQEVRKFLFGDEKTKTPNIFGKISKAFSDIFVSKAFQDVKGFFFGKEDTKGSRIPGLFENIRNIIAGVTEFGPFQEIKKFILGDYTTNTPSIFGRIAEFFKTIADSNAFNDIKTFFFGGTYSNQKEPISPILDRIGEKIQAFSKTLQDLKTEFLSLIPESFIETLKYIFDGGYFNGGSVSLKEFFLGTSESVSYLEFQLNRIKSTDWFQNVRDFLFGKKDNKAESGALNSFFHFFHTAEEYEKANIFGKIKLALQDLQIYLFGWSDATGDTSKSIEGKLTPIFDIVKKIGEALNNFRKWLGFDWKINETTGAWERQTGVIDLVGKKISEVVKLVAKFGKAVFNTVNSFRKWLGLDWELNETTGVWERKVGAIDKVKNAVKDFANLPAVQSVKEFLFGKAVNTDSFGQASHIPGLFENIGKIISSLVESKPFLDIKKFIVGDKETKAPSIFGRMSNLFKSISESTAFKDVQTFFLGGKYSFSNAVIWSLPKRLQKHLNEIAGSKAFTNVKEFFFGNKDKNKGNVFKRIGESLDKFAKNKNYTNFGELLFGDGKDIDNIFVRFKKGFHDFVFGNETKGMDNLLVLMKNTIHDFFLGNEDKGIDNLFIRMKTGFDNLIKNSGYANLHNFIFGNQKLNQDNIIVRFLDSVSVKLDELKNKFPWLQNIVTFISDKIEKIRNLAHNISGSIEDFIFGHDAFNNKTFKVEHIEGAIDHIKNFIEKVKSFQLFGKKEEKRGPFDGLINFFNSLSRCIQALTAAPRILSNVIGPLLVISTLLLGFRLGGPLNFSIESPLSNLVNMLQDFVTSVAIIVGLIVGLSILLPHLNPWYVIGATILVGSIMAALYIMAKKLSGAGEKNAGVIEGFKDAAGMFFMINFIRTIAALVAMLAGAIVALSIVSKLVGPDVVFASALSVALVIAAVGFSIKMMNDSFEKSKDATGKLKTHTGELWGIAAILYTLSKLIATIVIAFGVIYFLTKDKTLSEMNTPMLVLIGIFALIAGLLIVFNEVFKSVSNSNSISKKALAALISLELFITGITGLVWLMSMTSDWKSLAASFGGIAVIMFAMGFVMKAIASIKNVNVKSVLPAVLIALGSIASIALIVWELSAIAKRANINSWNDILPMLAAITEIAIAMIPVTAVIAIAGIFGKAIKKNITGVLAAIIGITALAFGVWGLAALADTANIHTYDAILPMLVAIGEVAIAVAVVSGLLAIAGVLGSAIDGVIVGVLTAIAGITVLAFGVWGLAAIADKADIHTYDAILPMLAAIGEVAAAMVVVSGLLVVAGLLGTVMAAVVPGLLAALIGFGVIAGIVWGLSKLSEEIGPSTIEDINIFMVGLAKTLGEMIGAFVGGFGEGVSESLPAIGENLSAFMTNLEGFLDHISSLNETHLTGAGIFSAIMLSIGADTVFAAFTALIGFITGNENLENVGTTMTNLITNMSGFLNRVTGITEAHVTGAGYFTSVLANIAGESVLNLVSALVQDVVGDENFEGVGTKMTNLIANMSGFLNRVTGITESHVTSAGYFTSVLANIAGESILNLVSAFVQDVVGDEKFEGVGTSMTNLITNLSGFLNRVSGITESHVTGAGYFTQVLEKITGQSILGMVSSLVTQVVGNENFEKVGTNMTNFINNLSGFLNKVQGVTDAHVTGAQKLNSVLRAMGGALVKAALDNLVAFFIGETNFKDLTDAMVQLAEGTVSFGQKLTETDLNTVESGVNIVKTLLDLVTDDEYKEGGISGFFNDIINGDTEFSILFSKLNNDIAPGVVEFANILGDTDLGKVNQASEILPKIFDMLTDKNYNTGGIGGWISKLVEGEADFNTLFEALLGKEGEENSGIIWGLSNLSEALNGAELKDVDYSKIATAIDALKSIFDLMSINFDETFISYDDIGYNVDSCISSAQKVTDSLSIIHQIMIDELKQLNTDLEGVNTDNIKLFIDSFRELLSLMNELSTFDASFIDVQQIGQFVIDGLAASLESESATSRITTAAINLGKAIYDGLMIGTESASPSKAAYRVGQFVAQGLTNGLVDGEPLSWKAARGFGEGTIQALYEGAERYAAYGLSQHAINMVTEDLVDENLFNMPDFSFTNYLGMDDIDFEKMRSFLQEKLGDVLDPTMIDGFVNSYMAEWNSIPKEIKNAEYYDTLKNIGKGEYGLGQDEIINNLEKELESREAANQAWEDYNDLLEGNLKISKDLHKEEKKNPPMTYEQYQEMIAHEQEGIELAKNGFFQKMAKEQGISQEQAMINMGYNPKITQDAINEMFMNTEEVYKTWEKMVADKELWNEEDRLLSEWEDYVLGIGKSAVKAEETIAKESENVTSSLEKSYKPLSKAARNVIGDFRKGNNLTKDELNNFLSENDDPEYLKSYLKKLNIDQKEFDEYISSQKKRNGIKDTSNYDSLDPKALNTLLKKITDEKGELTDADISMMKHLQQATVTEGMFGEGDKNREQLLEAFGIEKKYLELARKIASSPDIDKYIEDNVKIEKSTEALADQAKEVEKQYSNLTPEIQKVWDNLEKSVTSAFENGSNTFEFNIADIFGDAGDDVVKQITEKLGVDKVGIPIKSLGIYVKDENGKEVLLENTNDLTKYYGDKIDPKTVVSDIWSSTGLASVFGNIGSLEEMGLSNLADLGTTLFGSFLGKNQKDTLSFFSNLLSSIFKLDKGIEDIDNSKMDLHADYSEITAADAYIQSILDKYKLSEDEVTIAKQGYANLMNKDYITKAQQEALEKLWQGMVTGTYGKDMQTAIQEVYQSMDISWEHLNSYFGPGGHSLLGDYATDAVKYARELKDTKTLGSEYTIKDLVKDIYDKDLFGSGKVRKDALEALGADYEKVQKLVAEYGQHGDEAFKDLPDDYGFLTEAEIEAAKQKERLDTALASTPEGAFKAIGDFLQGVNTAIEKPGNAVAFTEFITQITDAMKSIKMENAPAFEQLANFLYSVKTAAANSSTIGTDFGTAMTGIQDVLNSVSFDADKFTPVTEFFTQLNKASESISGTLGPLTSLMADIVKISTADVTNISNEAVAALMEALIATLETYYSRFETIGINFITYLSKGMELGIPSAVASANRVATEIVSALEGTLVNQADIISQNFMKSLTEGFSTDESKALIKDALNALFGMPAEGTEDLGLVTGETGMESLGKSFGSSFGTDFITGFSESISGDAEVLQEKLKPIIDGLTGITDTFTTISNPGEAITGFVNDVGTAAEDSIDSDAMESIRQLCDILESTLRNCIPDGYGMGFAFVEGLYLGLLDGWTAYGALIVGITTQMGQGAYNGANSIVQAASPSKATFRLGSYFVEGFALGLQNGVNDVYDSGSSVGEAALEGFRDTLGINSPSDETHDDGEYFDEGMRMGIRENAYKVVEAAEELAQSVLNVTGEKLANEVNPIGMSFVEGLGEYVSNNLFDHDNINSNNLLNDFADISTDISDKATQIAGSAFKDAAVGLSKLSDTEADLLYKVWDDMMLGKFGVIGTKFTDEFGNEFADRNDYLVKKFGITWTDLYQYSDGKGHLDLTKTVTGMDPLTLNYEVEKAKKSLRDIIYDIYNGLYGIGKDRKDALGKDFEFLQGLVNQLANGHVDWDKAEKEAEEHGISIGDNSIQGIASGISNKIREVTDSGVKISSALTGAVTEELMIQSPSKLFMQFGEFIDQGLANGIRDNVTPVRDNIENLSDIITSTFNESVMNATDLIETNLNTDPVIRPVIDLTNVTESASKIDSMLSHDQAVNISTNHNALKNQNGSENDQPLGATYNFTQNNYSPKSLSRSEIYRQTKNQFAQFKEMKN